MRSYKTRAFAPVAALLWENWRLTYLAFFVALALGAGVTHSLAEMHRVQPDQIYDPVLPSYAICVFALFMYGAIVLFAHADPKALSTRIPNRHYCHPLRTGTIVVVNLAYRVASFSLLAVALFTLMRVEFGDLIGHGMALDAVVALTAISYVLAVAWSWSAMRPLITAAVVAALPLLVIVAAMKGDDIGHLLPHETFSVESNDQLATARRTIDTSTVTLGLILVAAGYCGIAYVSGHRGRLGSVPGTRSSSIASRVFGSGPRITSSAQQAQVWYEWRRKGLVLPGVTLCFTFAAMISAWIAEGTDLEITDFAEAFVLVPVYASVFAAFFTGLYMFSVDYRHATSGLSTFLYTRPLSTDAYTRARLRMSVQSVLVNLCLCLAIGMVGIVLSGVDGQRVRPEEIANIENLPLIVFVLVAYGLLLWSLLWMSVPVLVYLFWFGCYFYYQTLVNTEFEQISEHVHMFWLVWIPAAVLVAVTAFVWRHPVMWKSLSTSTVAQARRAMVVAFLAMVFCLLITDEVDPFGPDSFEVISIFLGIAGLSTLPALSILSQPLILNRFRTR